MNIEQHIIHLSLSLREALAKLNDLSGGAMTLIVIDDSRRMVGTLTDGDVRRALIAGKSLDSAVSEVMHSDFEWLSSENFDLGKLKNIRAKGIRLIPRLDAEKRIVDLVDLLKTPSILPVSALIMAGGKGERLRPATLTTPKPLLEICGRAIIDYNVEALAAAGIDEIFVSVNYLAEQLEQHFSRPVAGVNAVCVRENIPLGTIGALSLMPDFSNDTVLVMNSDLLTDISFEDMFEKHLSEQADITIAAIPYNLSVPYAILQTDGQRVVSLEEKPVYSYYANAGIYMLSRKAVELVKKGERTDATDLIERAIAAGMNVVYFPINGTWIDVGTPADFRHASDMMKYHSK